MADYLRCAVVGGDHPVKPSVWALLPIVAAGVARDRSLRDSTKDLLLFVGVAVAAAFAYKFMIMWQSLG